MVSVGPAQRSPAAKPKKHHTSDRDSGTGDTEAVNPVGNQQRARSEAEATVGVAFSKAPTSMIAEMAPASNDASQRALDVHLPRCTIYVEPGAAREWLTVEHGLRTQQTCVAHDFTSSLTCRLPSPASSSHRRP